MEPRQQPNEAASATMADHLMEMLGVSAARAGELLKIGDGDIPRAVQAHFDAKPLSNVPSALASAPSSRASTSARQIVERKGAAHVPDEVCVIDDDDEGDEVYINATRQTIDGSSNAPTTSLPTQAGLPASTDRHNRSIPASAPRGGASGGVLMNWLHNSSPARVTKTADTGATQPGVGEATRVGCEDVDKSSADSFEHPTPAASITAAATDKELGVSAASLTNVAKLLVAKRFSARHPLDRKCSSTIRATGRWIPLSMNMTLYSMPCGYRLRHCLKLARELQSRHVKRRICT